MLDIIEECLIRLIKVNIHSNIIMRSIILLMELIWLVGTTTVGSFQRPDNVELVVWDLAYAALADANAEPVAGLTGFVMVYVVAGTIVADAEAVTGLTGFVMVSAVVGAIVADVEAVVGLTGFLMIDQSHSKYPHILLVSSELTKMYNPDPGYVLYAFPRKTP
ncbi:hypothetical protein A2U01_0022039, partial [Trifolium medium]|nr:hypothetical protein [Trifolium medium]